MLWLAWFRVYLLSNHGSLWIHAPSWFHSYATAWALTDLIPQTEAKGVERVKWSKWVEYSAVPLEIKSIKSVKWIYISQTIVYPILYVPVGWSWKYGSPGFQFFLGRGAPHSLRTSKGRESDWTGVDSIIKNWWRNVKNTFLHHFVSSRPVNVQIQWFNCIKSSTSSKSQLVVKLLTNWKNREFPVLIGAGIILHIYRCIMFWAMQSICRELHG